MHVAQGRSLSLEIIALPSLHIGRATFWAPILGAHNHEHFVTIRAFDRTMQTACITGGAINDRLLLLRSALPGPVAQFLSRKPGDFATLIADERQLDFEGWIPVGGRISEY